MNSFGSRHRLTTTEKDYTARMTESWEMLIQERLSRILWEARPAQNPVRTKAGSIKRLRSVLLKTIGTIRHRISKAPHFSGTWPRKCNISLPSRWSLVSKFLRISTKQTSIRIRPRLIWNTCSRLLILWVKCPIKMQGSTKFLRRWRLRKHQWATSFKLGLI